MQRPFGGQNRNTTRVGVRLSYPGDNCWALTTLRREGGRKRQRERKRESGNGPATRCTDSRLQLQRSAEQRVAAAAETKRVRRYSRSRQGSKVPFVTLIRVPSKAKTHLNTLSSHLEELQVRAPESKYVYSQRTIYISMSH